VGVYVDGVNYPRNYGLRSSLIDVAQIEVLKGPQGTLFGKNTTGGALNITTQQPTYDPGGYVDFLYGSYNNARALVALNLPIIKDKLAVRFAGQSISRDGYGEDITGNDVSDDNVLSGRLQLLAEPTPASRIVLSADYVRQRNNGSIIVITKDAMMGSVGLLAVASQLGLDPSSSTDLQTAYDVWRSYYDAYQDDPYQSFQAPFPNDTIYDNLDHYGFSVNGDLEMGSATLKSVTAYRRLETRDVAIDLDATPFYILNSSGISTRQQNFSQEIQLSAIDGAGLDWQVGVFYSHETGNEYQANEGLIYINANRAAIIDADIENTSKAAFAQAVLNFTDNFRMTGGVRYTEDKRVMDSHNRLDPANTPPPILNFPSARCNLLDPALGGPTFPNCSYEVSQTTDKTTWLISADWRPVQQLMLYGSVSTGYRAGGFTYNGSGGVQNSLAALEASYAPFQPEEVTNYEVGFKSDVLDNRMRINGAVFYQDYSDIQKLIRDLVNNVPVNLIRNAAKAELYGGEVEVVAKPSSSLTLDAGLSYLHAEYGEFIARDSAGNALDLTNQPFSAPEWTYNLGATYEVPLNDGSLRFNAHWAWTDDVNFQPDVLDQPTSVYDPASLSQEAFGLLDARITWRIESKRIDLSLFGKNLTDEEYLAGASNAQRLGWNYGFPGDPRTIGIQLRKSF
tara:strand:- start:8492 stop:10531 length:2040 start_codon:yes stop_codon:yes gene_type:complete